MIALDERVTFGLQCAWHCLVHMHLLHYLCVHLFMVLLCQVYAQMMQLTHTRKAVAWCVKAHS